jgi:thioredoxin-like negative regulator of GroEL
MKRLVVQGRDRRGTGCASGSCDLTHTASELAGANLASSGRCRSVRVALTVLCIVSLATIGCRSKERLPDVGSKTYTDFVSAFYVGLAGLQVGDDVRADAKLQRATELVPGEPAGWVDWGVLALRQRNFDAAAQRLNRAHTLLPNDDRMDYLLGLLEGARGNSVASISYLHQAIALNPRNLRALYSLATQVERQGDENSDAELEKILQQILTVQPGNLAVMVDLCRVSAKRGDAATLRATVAQIAARSHGWPPEIQEQLEQLQTAAAGPAPRSAATRSTFLRNVLMREPEFRASLSEIMAPPGEEAQPVTRFLRLPNPPSQPAAPDLAMTYTNEPVAAAVTEPWTWVGAIALNGSDAPVMAEANAHDMHLATGADLPFPGGAAASGPSPEGILPFDFNYDFKTDLLLAGDKGLRLFRQDQPDHFTDVTAAMKLPNSVTNAAYTGAWAIDLEADGDLDVVVGAKAGMPSVLRNNGDGTFVVEHPFAGLSGIRQFAWADLNGDGNPDAVLIDGSGSLHIFFNQRAGKFTEIALPRVFTGVSALCVADTGSDDRLRLHLLSADGNILSLSYDDSSAKWTEHALAQIGGPVTNEVRLRAADVDNNGAVDLLVLPVRPGGNANGARIWLQDEAGTFKPMPAAQGPSTVFDTADLHGDGHLDLLGLDASGRAVDAPSHLTKSYHWQTIRPRARVVRGDQRINPFGIGGEIEIRSALLLQTQAIASPVLHFGLGEQQGVDVARIVWPNGSVRAEFALKADQQIVTEQRLKGSCPFLFAWNGKRMDFVKDSVPWGSAIGLRINSLGTANIAATEEWYKIGRDHLQPRNGFYDLRVTGELWETYFYDALSLMTVDHPAGTEIFTDERYDVPPVRLAITAVGPPQPIAHATDDNGNNVTATLRTLDGRYLDNFGRGQYQGVTRDHFVEIDLGDRIPEDGPLWLIAKGWLHPSDSSVNVAMSQGEHPRPQWLTLEVPNGKGGWRVAQSNLGFPAGRNKICLINLTGLFPPGTPHRLRLRTNLEVYWDSIEWVQGLPETPMKITRLSPSIADLHYRGFSVIHQANASSPEIPDYDRLASTSPIWRDLPGFYTRFGDVRELLAHTDDRYVIMNAGDEMALRFVDPGPPPAGWVRDFVIAGDGWIKDGDYNTADSQTVLPYPYHARKDYDSSRPSRLKDDWVYRHHIQDWQTYQTRYVTAEAFQHALRSGPAQ